MSDVDDAAVTDDDSANTEPVAGGDVASVREQADIAGGEVTGTGTFPWNDPDRPENAEALGGAGFRDVQMPVASAFNAPDGSPITSDQPLAVDTSGPAPVLVPATTQADVAASRGAADPGGPAVVNEADLNASGQGIPDGATVAPRGTLDTGEAGGTVEGGDDVHEAPLAPPQA